MMRLMSSISIAAIMFGFVGCAMPISITTGQVMPGYQIPTNSKFVVLNIPDGHERGQDPTFGSGQAMVSSLKEQLMIHGCTVTSVDSKDLSDGFKEAERLGYTHVFKGTFTHWEDNATEWSSNPDRATFSLELFDLQDKRLVASSTHQKQSSGAAMFSASPTRFVPELAERTLARILGWQPKAQAAKQAQE
ncbi:MAG TPA: DUF4823 domain-containing protein [Holophagaceae bacterium]|nr:DUF4823 domain-containing protein [Holophagaceae bacterium]